MADRGTRSFSHIPSCTCESWTKTHPNLEVINSLADLEGLTSELLCLLNGHANGLFISLQNQDGYKHSEPRRVRRDTWGCENRPSRQSHRIWQRLPSPQARDVHYQQRMRTHPCRGVPWRPMFINETIICGSKPGPKSMRFRSCFRAGGEQWQDWRRRRHVECHLDAFRIK
jgi:hypothetical protein